MTSSNLSNKGEWDICIFKVHIHRHNRDLGNNLPSIEHVGSGGVALRQNPSVKKHKSVA